MKRYIHKETGSIATKEDWISSYSTEELEHRGLTAEQAFNADLGVTLFGLINPKPKEGGHCKDCDHWTGRYCGFILEQESHRAVGDEEAHISYYVHDDSGLDIGLVTGPEFGCTSYKSKE